MLQIRFGATAIGLAIALIAGACGSSGDGETAPASTVAPATTAAPTTTSVPATTAAPTTTATPTTTTEERWTAEDTWDMCAVFGAGGRKDGGLNQATWMQHERFRIKLASDPYHRYREDYGAATVHRTETSDDFSADDAIDRYATAGCDVVVTSGRDLQQATADAASRHPDLVLIGMDQWFTEHPNQLYGFHFPGETGGLLAGALAASLTTTGTVAILVDGDGGPAADAWQTGFEAGVAHADDTVNVVSEDATGDGAAAARVALDQGADVVFAADPDHSDPALVEVAGQAGAYCIGIGTDRWKAVPDAQPCLVTSIVKAVGRATAIVNPVFDSYSGRILVTVTEGRSGETMGSGNYALDIELAPFHDHEDAVPVEVVEMLAALDDSTRALHGQG